MADVVDLVSDGELGEDIPGPTRAELHPSACSHEATWFSQKFRSPTEQVLDSSIPTEHVHKFQDLIWKKPHDRMVPGYGMTPKELASVASEGRRGWLVTSHFYWLSRCINHQQNHTRFFVFDPTIRKASIEKLLVTKTSDQIKQIVFVLSVGRQDDGIVFLGTDKIPGDHWSMAVVDIHSGVLTYCDTLGWPLPVKFNQAVIRYTSVLGLTAVSQLTVRLAHKPDEELHTCSGECTNYPLQTCSDVCGVIAMVCVAIAALDKSLFELLLKRQQVCQLYLTNPTEYSTYLRHVVLHWLAENHIDMTRISLKPGFDPFVPVAAPEEKSRLGVKRKLEPETNGCRKSGGSSSKKKQPLGGSGVSVDNYILEAVESRVSPQDIVSEVCELFTPEAVKSLDSLNADMVDCYKDIVFNEAIERYKDDGLSLKSYVRDLIDCPYASSVIMFKNQGTELKTLEKDDTILAIQTPFQKEMMRAYGRKCVCVDLSRRRESDKFHLYTILVFVEGKAEVPVAWLITNRTDNLVLNLFFKTLKMNVGSLETEIFIGDISSSFYKTWSLHFPKPRKRMHSVWETFHVLSSRLNSFVADTQDRKRIKEYLSIIPLITNVKACQHYISALLEALGSHEDFRDYFKERYVSDSKIENWASCYRTIPLSKFTPFLRPFTKTLAHLGLHGGDQTFSRADVLLHKLLQISRFLEYKVHIKTSEVQMLKACNSMAVQHTNASQGLDIYTSASGDAWFIRASSETNSFCVLDTGVADCSCTVRCNTCKFCIHKYLCSCSDFLLNAGGCRHMHSIHTFRKMNEVLNSSSILSSSHLDSTFAENAPASGSATSRPKTLGAELNIDRLRRQAKRELTSLVESLHTIQDASALKKMCERIRALQSEEPNACDGNT